MLRCKLSEQTLFCEAVLRSTYEIVSRRFIISACPLSPFICWSSSFCCSPPPAHPHPPPHTHYHKFSLLVLCHTFQCEALFAFWRVNALNNNNNNQQQKTTFSACWMFDTLAKCRTVGNKYLRLIMRRKSLTTTRKSVRNLSLSAKTPRRLPPRGSLRRHHSLGQTDRASIHT